MQGFGIQTKNIDELIKKIEQEIAFITKNIDKSIVVLNNKLVYCTEQLTVLKKEFNDLKEDVTRDINTLENEVEDLLAQVEELKENIVNVQYASSARFGEIVASGIAPWKYWEEHNKTHPIYAKYADYDGSGRLITDTYLTSADFDNVISAINARINENSANISSMSSTISNINNRLNNVENTIAAATTSYTIDPCYVITAIKQTSGKITISTADNAATTAQVNDFIQW